MQKLIELIYSRTTDNWTDRCKEAFEKIYGSNSGRYPDRAKRLVTLRAPMMTSDTGIPFASLIHPSNPDSGAYGGMCFVIFPVNDAPWGVALGIGTQGLNPDEEILGRPGHARKINAICTWINKKYGFGKMLAWAKQDPVQTDLDVP